MKKLIYILLLVPFCVNAQIINFPDANFKAKLLQASSSNQIASTQIPIFNSNGSVTVTSYNTVDTNGDGQIQITEAQAIRYLDIHTASITNSQGIESFTNLIYLDCSSNQLPSINVSGMTNLKKLNCMHNALTSLDVDGLTDLQYLFADYNQLTSIDVVSLTNLQQLNCGSNQLTDLNVNGLANLKYLFSDHNQLTNLDASNLANLLQLNCAYNQLSILEVDALTNLQQLNCSYNQLTSLNLDSLNNLEILDCYNNLFANIDVSSLTNLQNLRCMNNQLTSLDVTNLASLQNLSCFNNQLTSLDVNGLTNLTFLFCNSNLLTTLFIKNNNISWLNLNFDNNPNINYICVDEDKLDYVIQKVNGYGYADTCFVSSYCSFTPSGNYNTITGSMIFDANNNGCDASDLTQPNIKININDGTNQGATFTNNSAVYNFYTQAGSFTITPNFENLSWFTFSPASATIPFADNNNNVITQNFCIAPNGIHNDLEVVIAPVTPARPGFDATYQIVYKNKGNQTLSGNINLTFDDDKTDFVSAFPNPDNLAVNALSWNYTNLLPFESRTINVTLNVNSPQETPPVNIGDQLDFVVAINPVVNDEIPIDNSFSYKQIVVGSFDPNSIECLEGEIVPTSYIGQYLHYAVNFENTGNYPAENIVVKIVIDTTKYDLNSLQLLNVSHNSYTRITGNVVEVIFQQINLDSGGHGNLLFKIKSNNNLVEGNVVAKRADIFFDYNAPIDTGMANTTFQILSNSIFELDDSISIYPNPTNGNVTINSSNTIKSVELFDVQGRLLQAKLHDELQTSIDISEQSNGIYFLKITSDKGSKVEKIVKE